MLHRRTRAMRSMTAGLLALAVMSADAIGADEPAPRSGHGDSRTTGMSTREINEKAGPFVWSNVMKAEYEKLKNAAPCDAVYLGQTRDNMILFSIPTDTAFGTADAIVLQKDFRACMDALVRSLRRADRATIRIFSHTDGKTAYDMKFPWAQQGEDVAYYLEEHGVARGRITTIAQGGREPVTYATTESEMARNRRIDVVFGEPAH